VNVLGTSQQKKNYLFTTKISLIGSFL